MNLQQETKHAQVSDLSSSEFTDSQVPRDDDNKLTEDDSDLTIRAVVLGALLGFLTSAQNVYFAFKYGWTTMGNTTSAILGFGIMQAGSKLSGDKRQVGQQPDDPSSSILRRVFGGFGARENVVLQTAAVASCSMVGGASLPFAIFAMTKQIQEKVNLPGDSDLDDTWHPSVMQLILYCFSLCFFGFFIALPLRHRFVEKEKLTFPFATASAVTIQTLHSAGETGAAAVRSLLYSLIPSFLLKVFLWCVDGLESFPILGNEFKSKYKWKLNVSAANFGQGLIIPARYVLSQLFGSLLASGFLLPLARAHHGDWYKEGVGGFQGPDAYYYIAAIAVVSVDSVFKVTKLLYEMISGYLSQRSNAQNVRCDEPSSRAQKDSDFRLLVEGSDVVLRDESNDELDEGHEINDSKEQGLPNADREEQLDNSDPIVGKLMSQNQFRLGCFISGLFPIITFSIMFKSPFYMVILATILAPVWSIGIGHAVGTTGSNMASSCGKLMIMIFAAWSGSSNVDTSGTHAVVSSLALGALSIAVIDQAMDLVRDFKTAHLIGASPRSMFIAQVVGSALSCVFSSLVYYAITSDDSVVPSKQLPAVIAESYRAIAVIFNGGFSQLPKYCLFIGGCFGLFAAFNNLLQLYCTSQLREIHRRQQMRLVYISSDGLNSRINRLVDPEDDATRKERIFKAFLKWSPSSVAIGIGLYLLVGQSITTFMGLACKLIYSRHCARQSQPDSIQSRINRHNSHGSNNKVELIGAGMIAGDGLGGLLTNIFTLVGMKPVTKVEF